MKRKGGSKVVLAGKVVPATEKNIELVNKELIANSKEDKVVKVKVTKVMPEPPKKEKETKKGK